MPEAGEILSQCPEEVDPELDLINIQPITLDDIRASRDYDGDDSDLIDWDKRNHYAELCFGKRKRISKLHSDHDLWNRALSKASSVGDEWENFDVEGLPEEKALRYRYDAVGGHWVTDDVTLKMERESFNAGAMRRCFRCKKPFGSEKEWRRGNTNYVAKEYMDPVDRQVYFDDVMLQMEAKLWGMEYDRHNPPKKVDIMQMCCVELVDRPGKPLFHLEHHIEGDYVKYNSNSGFVRDDNLRSTPQAFSHFTFERSGHELMVVDIQGVGDLYTDPQMHTADGKRYGDGNLGTRGMTLFFHSHVCNVICKSLGLTEFDLAATETRELSPIAQKQVLCKTVSRGSEEPVESPAEYGFDRVVFRSRSPSSGCWSSEDVNNLLELDSPPALLMESESSRDEFLAKRKRFLSECSTGSTEAMERARFMDAVIGKQRPSNVLAEQERIGSAALPSILGQMHFDLAKYHEVGRFLGPQRPAKGGEYDREAALFHLERAVDCGVLPAIITAADLYLGRPRDLLTDVQIEATADNRGRGVALLTRAAAAGDRTSMVDLARSYDLGSYLPRKEEDKDWSKAVDWYERAALLESETRQASEDEPSYLLLGRAAEMLKTGGPCLEHDYSRAAEMFSTAAESASAMMKGRAANRFFMAADECWAMCDE